jgi:hypothetical protein
MNTIAGNNFEGESTPYLLNATNPAPFVVKDKLDIIPTTNNTPAAIAGRACLFATNPASAELYSMDGAGNVTLQTAHDGDIPVSRSWNVFTGRSYKKDLWAGTETKSWMVPVDTWAAMHEREYVRVSNNWQEAKDAFDADPDNYADPGAMPVNPKDPKMPQWMVDGLNANTCLTAEARAVLLGP